MIIEIIRRDLQLSCWCDIRGLDYVKQLMLLYVMYHWGMSHVKFSDSYSFTWLGYKSAHRTLKINLARFEMPIYVAGLMFALSVMFGVCYRLLLKLGSVLKGHFIQIFSTWFNKRVHSKYIVFLTRWLKCKYHQIGSMNFPSCFTQEWLL